MKGLRKELENVPYSERIILLPDCLSRNGCSAKKGKYGIINCFNCEIKRVDGYQCPIPEMTSIALEIGYKGVYTFSGPSGIEAFIKENSLEGVLAIACEHEVENGLKMMEGSGIPAQIKLLKIEGCVETEVFNNHNEFSEEWRNILTKYPSKNGN